MWLLLTAVASAQSPIDLSGLQLPPGIDLSSLGLGNVSIGGPKAEMRWLKADAASTRFPDDATPGPTFTAAEMVEVVVVEGARTRIRKGDRYGWVSNASLTLDAPIKPAALNPLNPLNPLPAGSAPAHP